MQAGSPEEVARIWAEEWAKEGRKVDWQRFMPSREANTIVSTPGMGEDFVEVINEGSQELFTYPGVVRKTISTSSTNKEALREMTERNLEALLVTDENDRLKGIAEREQVLSGMMLALTS